MNDIPGPRAGVLCAGTILVDVGKVIDAYPVLDHLATIEQVSLSTGGPGLNMAVDLRMLGATFPIGMLGTVGEDEHAAFILAECARLGIDTTGVRTLVGAVTSFTDAMIERDGGRRTFFHHSGANALFDASTADMQSSRARMLHAGAPGIHRVMDSPLPGDGNGWSALLQRAQAAGLHTNLELVSLTPGRTAEVALPCLPHLDSIVINELEAGALTGIDAPVPTACGPVDWPALEAMALGMIERGVSVLAVVHFPAGCVAAAPGGRTWRQGSVRLPREQVRSTTGAGDAFAAGIILGLHERWPVERCLQLGVASAAACVRSPNTSDGIKPAETCLAEADRAGYRQPGMGYGRWHEALRQLPTATPPPRSCSATHPRRRPQHRLRARGQRLAGTQPPRRIPRDPLARSLRTCRTAREIRVARRAHRGPSCACRESRPTL
jgi:sugar/nucleoside kinase (ribokinase family)